MRNVYVACMSQQRSKGQKPVIVYMNEAFIREIDHSLVKLGFSDRSSLIRTAVLEKLNRERTKQLPKQLIASPPRVGKGGRPKKT